MHALASRGEPEVVRTAARLAMTPGAIRAYLLAAPLLDDATQDAIVADLVQKLAAKPGPRIRQAVTTALGRWKRPGCIDALGGVLRHDSEAYNRAGAADSLGEHSGLPAERLLRAAMARESDHYVRWHIIRALAQQRSPTARATLLALHGADAPAALDALSAHPEYRTEALISTLTARLQSTLSAKTADCDGAVNLTMALARFARPESTQALEAVLAVPHCAKRRTQMITRVIDAWGRHAASHGFIARYANDPDRRVRIAVHSATHTR